MSLFLLVILIPWTMAIAQDDSLIGTWAGKFGLVGIPEDDVRIQFEADGSLVYIQPITLALDSSSDPVQVTPGKHGHLEYGRRKNLAGGDRVAPGRRYPGYPDRICQGACPHCGRHSGYFGR